MTEWWVERSLYSMRSIFIQCKDRRVGVMWLDLAALTTACAREFWICWSRVIWHLGRLWRCSSRAWSEQWKWRWWKLFWYRGMDGYSEAGEYGNSKIWKQMRSGQKKWGVHRIWSRGFEQSEWCWVKSCGFWQIVHRWSLFLLFFIFIWKNAICAIWANVCSFCKSPITRKFFHNQNCQKPASTSHGGMSWAICQSAPRYR